MLYAGGPVWALEWCPTPDGAPATQYIALSCHQRMDDFHYVNKTSTGTGLIQLWDVGKLKYGNRYKWNVQSGKSMIKILYYKSLLSVSLLTDWLVWTTSRKSPIVLCKQTVYIIDGSEMFPELIRNLSLKLQPFYIMFSFLSPLSKQTRLQASCGL